MKIMTHACSVLFALTPAITLAQGFQRTDVSSTHPIIGNWRIDYPDIRCYSEIRFLKNGTYSWHDAAGELIEKDFNISEAPISQGYYKLILVTTGVNGKPDCWGRIVPQSDIGKMQTWYMRMHPSGAGMLYCQSESLPSCIYEVLRQKP